MATRKHSITVADVARLAKVSKATAARVLGGYGVTSDKTRLAVKEAADTLGYRSNELARSMSTGRSGLIGVVVGDIENTFFSSAVRGISDVAKAEHLNVVITNSNENLEQEQQMVSLLMNQRVAGMIVAPTDVRYTDHLAAVIASGTPVVTLDRMAPALAADSVCGDDKQGTLDVMAYLHSAGHRQIAYITALASAADTVVNVELIGITAVRERISSFRASASDAGVDNPLGLVFPNATGDEAAVAIVDQILAIRPEVTAILASDSLVGASVFKALQSRNVRIPDDISFVSWFDSDWSRLTSPPVSVVDQPTYRFGEVAMELLAKRLRGESSKLEHVKIPTPFINRQSIAPVPTDRATMRRFTS